MNPDGWVGSANATSVLSRPSNWIKGSFEHIRNLDLIFGSSKLASKLHLGCNVVVT